MNDDQAEVLAVRLYSSYPGRQIGDMHVAAAMNALRYWPLDIGEEAIRVLIERAMDPPSVAAIMATCREVQASKPTPALPTPPCQHGHVEAECPECRWQREAALRRFQEKSAGLRQSWAEQAAELERKRQADAEERQGRLRTAKEREIVVDPNRVITTGGPRCVLCGAETIHDGGVLWYCPDDGWVVRRGPRNDPALRHDDAARRLFGLPVGRRA
jgi:hypothetical protein